MPDGLMSPPGRCHSCRAEDLADQDQGRVGGVMPKTRQPHCKVANSNPPMVPWPASKIEAMLMSNDEP